MRLVVDASAIAEVVLRTELSTPFLHVMRSPDAEMHVPALCDLELVSVLRGALLRGSLTADRAEEALADYLSLPLKRHSHERLLWRIFELRENFSAYDGCYVALAEALDATLVTGDRRLAAAVREHASIDAITSDGQRPADDL